MILSAPTRTWCEWTTHRRTWQPCCYCPLGGGGDGVVLRTRRWSGYSVGYGLEEWGKGKGEKGGEDLVKDEQLLPHRAATTLARGGHRRLILSDDHVGESSSSSSS